MTDRQIELWWHYFWYWKWLYTNYRHLMRIWMHKINMKKCAIGQYIDICQCLNFVHFQAQALHQHCSIWFLFRETTSSPSSFPFLKYVHHNWLHDARYTFFCVTLVYWDGLFLSSLPSSAQTKQTRAFAQVSPHKVSAFSHSFIPLTFPQRNHQSSTIQSIPWSQDIMQSLKPKNCTQKWRNQFV